MKKLEVRVLIVDDDVLACEALRLCLANNFIHVVGIFQSGVEAINQLKYLKPDVIIWDDSLPDMDGEQALKTMNDIRPGIPTLLLTTNSTSGSYTKVLAEGAFAIFDKQSIDFHSLPQIVRHLSFRDEAIVEARILQAAMRNNVAPESNGFKGGYFESREILNPVNLTINEFEILKLLLRDHDLTAIAVEFGSDVEDVKEKVASICKKLMVENISELKLIIDRLGYLEN